jgi:hypothetical protein
MQATDGNDRIGKVEEGVYDLGAAFVAAGEPVEGVLPVGSLDVPPLAGLDRWLFALVCDSAVQTARSELGASFVRVVAGVQMHGDFIWQ